MTRPEEFATRTEVEAVLRKLEQEVEARDKTAVLAIRASIATATIAAVAVVTSALVSTYAPSDATLESSSECAVAIHNVRRTIDDGVQDPNLLQKINSDNVDRLCGDELVIAHDIFQDMYESPNIRLELAEMSGDALRRIDLDALDASERKSGDGIADGPIVDKERLYPQPHGLLGPPSANLPADYQACTRLTVYNDVGIVTKAVTAGTQLCSRTSGGRFFRLVALKDLGASGGSYRVTVWERA